MARFKVLQVTDEEYAKSDADPQYVAKEYVAGTIEAPNETLALRKLARQQKLGFFDRSAELVEID